MIIEYVILTYDTLFTVLEYMYMTITTYTDMSTVVTISHIYVSNLNKL
jgi:hypothetical protein